MESRVPRQVRDRAASEASIAEEAPGSPQSGSAVPAQRTFRDARTSDGGIGRAMVVVAAVLLVLLVKPWDLGQPRRTPPLAPPAGASSVTDPRARAAVPDDAAAATATTRAAPVDPDLTACFDSADWFVVTVEHDGGQIVRSWTLARPGPGSGPLDPGLPVVRVAVGRLVGLGFCAPRQIPADGQSRGQPALAGDPLATWRLGDGPRLPVQLAGLAPLTAATPDDAALLRGPSGAPWPAGRFVFELPGRTAIDPPRWLAVEVTATGGA